MTYVQAYGLIKQANTQQPTGSALQDAFNLGGQMGGAVGGGTAGLVGGGLAGAAVGYNLPDWFSKAQKASKLNKILAALGGGVLGAGAGLVAGTHGGHWMGGRVMDAISKQ